MPLTGPVLLAANHTSFLDPPLVGSGLRRDVHFLARESLFRFRLSAALLRRWNSIPVDRDWGRTGLRNMLKAVAEGNAVVVFPEGTRSRDGSLQRARSGIGLAVIKSGAPVVPIRLFGTHEAFGRDTRFPRPGRVVVKYGQPLTFTALRGRCETASREEQRRIYQEVADEIMAAIAALAPSPDPDPPPDPPPGEVAR